MNPIFPPRVRVPFLLLLLALLAISPQARGSGKAIWKTPPLVQLSLDGHPLKTWNVYQDEKKKNLLLALVGRRYLLLDRKARTVEEINPRLLVVKGDYVESADPLVGKPIPSSDWDFRDIGPAELIHVRLADYGRVLEIEIPHPPDMRWIH